MAAERLVKHLGVNPVSNTYLISISLRGRQAEGLAKIVNAVVDAYLQGEQRRESTQSDERVRVLVQHRAALDKEITKLRKKESELAQELGVSSFGPNFTSPYDKMLSDADEALDVARRATIQAQAHLDALKAEQHRAESLEVQSTAEQMVASDFEANTARQELTRQREAIFLQLQQLGPEHPGRPALEEEIQHIDDELSRLKSDRVQGVSSMLQRKHRTKAQQDFSAAQAQLEQARLTQSGIEQELAELQARAASFGSRHNEAVAIDANLLRDTAELQQIDEQIGVLGIQTQSPGFVSLESRAMTPDIAVQGKKRLILGISFVAALVLAIGLPVGLDMIDPLVKTAEELEAIVGLPPFGAVLGNEDRRAREALRRLALGVTREGRASGTRNFVLTSVTEGPTSGALAVAMAQQLNELGIRAAALCSRDIPQRTGYAGYSSFLDPHNLPGPRALEPPSLADLFSAEPRSNSRLPHPAGNVDVQEHLLDGPSGEIAITAYGKEGERPNPADGSNRTAGAKRDSSQGHKPPVAHNGLAPASGDTSGNPAALSSAREVAGGDMALMPAPLRVLLDKVRNSYEVLLFDTPPILVSADAEMLIQLPAGAILVVRSGHDVPRDISAALRRLERSTPPVVGTVLAFSRPDASGLHPINYSPGAILKRWLAAR